MYCFIHLGNAYDKVSREVLKRVLMRISNIIQYVVCKKKPRILMYEYVYQSPALTFYLFSVVMDEHLKEIQWDAMVLGLLFRGGGLRDSCIVGVLHLKIKWYVSDRKHVGDRFYEHDVSLLFFCIVL